MRDLLWEVTAGCHDEEEQFWSVFYTLAEGGPDLPLQAKMLGEPVEVVDLDGAHSGLRLGTVALAELEFVDLDPASAEWLEVYRYWLELR